MSESEETLKRQLDRSVAEWVMGIAVLGECMVGTGDEGEEFVRFGANPTEWMCRMELRPVMVDYCYCSFEGRDASKRIAFGHEDMCLKPVPRYSEDLNCAFEVVRKIRELGYAYMQLESENDNTLSCRFKEDVRGEWRSSDIVETPALAICFAALEVMKDINLRTAGTPNG